MHILDVTLAGDTLKVVSTCSVGYDHLDVAELKSRGIRIGYTPGVLSESVGEQAMAVLLATSRRVVESYNVILEYVLRQSLCTISYTMSI